VAPSSCIGSEFADPRDEKRTAEDADTVHAAAASAEDKVEARINEGEDEARDEVEAATEDGEAVKASISKH